MTLERTSVYIDVQGENRAKATVRALEQDMKRLEDKAEAAQREVALAESKSGRLNDLLQRAKSKGMIKRSGVEFGAMELGAGGFGLNQSYFRGAGGGAGLAFFAVRGAQIATGAMASVSGSAADAYAWYRENERLSAWQLAKRGFAEAQKSVVESFRAPDVAKSFWRFAGMLGGRVRSEALADEAMDEVLANAYGAGPTALDVALDQQRRAMRELRKKVAEAEREFELQQQQAHAKAEAEIDKRAAGLHAVRPPVRLSRQQARAYKQAEQAGRERYAEKAKQALETAEGW
jgi:hypothetical protein